MEEKFCCARLGIRHNAPREAGMNFRIVKYSPEGRLDKKNLYRFYFTPGYDHGEEKVMHINIRFCPFCGTDLYAFYQSDEFINEAPGFF